jgi:ACS family glucarate transporter-like MFS transporter
MFFLLTPITFVMSLDRTAITVAAPTIQHEYGFTLAEMSLILTRFSWPCSALRVPGG